jgi:hypothetical protein
MESDKEALGMEELLACILEQYAEKTEKQSQRDLNTRNNAYMAGKAEGLRLAKDLISLIDVHRTVNENQVC